MVRKNIYTNITLCCAGLIVLFFGFSIFSQVLAQTTGCFNLEGFSVSTGPGGVCPNGYDRVVNGIGSSGTVASGDTTLKSFVEDTVLPLGNQLVVVLVGAAVVIFFWGIVRYIYSAGNEKASEQGRRLMFWGVISLFVIISVWGIVALLNNTFFGNQLTQQGMQQGGSNENLFPINDANGGIPI